MPLPLGWTGVAAGAAAAAGWDGLGELLLLLLLVMGRSGEQRWLAVC